MKSFHLPTLCAVVFLLMGSALPVNAAPTTSSAAASNEVWSVFERFVKEKHALEKSLAIQHKVELPKNVDEFFAAEQKGDWIASSNLFFAIGDRLGKVNPDHKPLGFEPWGPVHDSYGTYEIIHAMNPKFVKMFGEEIVKSIPAGSIYFGGTDHGRFLVSAFSQSHSEGQPFFTITQNALASPDYLGYVADMYGNKINMATTNDSENCTSNYTAEAKARLLHDQKFPHEPRQVRPGEDVHLDEAGKMQFNNQISVMAINALIVKVFFDKNPTKEFYVEESFPLDWMFPHLTPAGLVMKLNREDIPALSEDLLKEDHEFWAKYAGQLVGDWITYDTPVKDVAAFAERVYLKHDYGGFKGDEDFIRDEEAPKAFSKLRSSIAGVYGWRLGQPPSGGVMPTSFVATGANRELILREADFAFKQAFALCPSSPEAVYRYVQFLMNAGRVDDALLVAGAAQKIEPDNTQFKYLMNNLNSLKSQRNSSADIPSDIARFEKAVNANPTNIMQQFELAQKYVQAGQNESAYKVLDRILASSHLTLSEAMSVADAFNRLNQPQRLMAAVERLTQLAPESPEAWYDLAAVRATLGQTAPGLEALKKSLELSDKRLAQDSKAKDVRVRLSGDERFSKLRDMEEFTAMVGP